MDLNYKFLDRARGAFLGLAVGDALGTTLEFSVRDRLPPVTDMVGGGPFNLPAGYWTDDTSMAMCIADSLLAERKFSPFDIMERFVRWRDEGENSPTGKCFDIGGATSRALDRFIDLGNPYSGSTGSYDSGNGGIMRLAPAVLHALHDRNQASHYAREQSRLTHASPECLEAAELMGVILFDYIHGRTPLMEGFREEKISAIARGNFAGKERKDIRSSGYVVHTLEAALWAIEQTDNFKDALLLAVNLGDDADTVGAVTGQIAGAKWGTSAIPVEWTENLYARERIELAATEIVKIGMEARKRDPGYKPPSPF